MEIETIAAPPPSDGGGSSNEAPQKEVKQTDSGAQKEAERKYKVKFGKEEREVPERELIAGYQKGWASDERFKAGHKAKQEAQELLEKADIDELIKRKFGKDKKTWAKEYLISELKKAQMTPEEAEAEERKQRVEALRREEEELLEKKAQARIEERTKHYQERWDKELAESLDKHKIPKNKYVLGRALKIADEIINMDLEPDWDLVVAEAKNQWQGEMLEALDNSGDDFGFLGVDRAKKVAKWLQSQGMPKKDAEKEAVKIVKQADAKPDKQPVDSDTYWENKRKQWEK